MSKDRWWHSLIIVLTIFGVGSWLITGWPFHKYLILAAEQARADWRWLPLVAGIAYVLGFFVTRTVEDSFEGIFGKPPFSEIGQKSDKGQAKHPAWVDHMLGPLGYVLFFVRVAVILGIFLGLLWAGLWLVSRHLAPAAG